MSRRALVIAPGDNVANALEEIASGETVAFQIEGTTAEIVAREPIPFGFKVALSDLPIGGPIVKYGEIVGRATRPIARGDLVHVHNVEGARGRGDLEAKK